jgi:hypothetical protein
MRLFFTFLFLSFASLLSAQNATLNGKLVDETTKEAIEYATITVKADNQDSKVLGGKSTQNGQFSIKNIPYGNYTITISSIGYEPETYKKYVLNQPEINLGTIALNSKNKSLKGVKIVGEKASMEIGIDKKTFNVDKNITSAGGTAADILRNVPSVNVDMDGNLSVRGKENVTLLVDGKPSAMFGNDAATALATLPASSIESVEVITNPSSKYEAQGMNGIVNIILKKDRKPGYNGMFTVGLATPFRFNTGINFNANINKFNIFMNANGRTSRVWEETTNDRDNYDNDETFSSFTRNDRRPLSGFMNAGLEYTLDKNNKFTFSQSIFRAAMEGDSKTNIITGENYLTQLARTFRANQYTGNPLNGTTNLQYKHTFKNPKEDINFDISFSKSQYI